MTTVEQPKAKRSRGRPARPEPERIPDTPENIVQAVVRTRSPLEIDRILRD